MPLQTAEYRIKIRKVLRIIVAWLLVAVLMTFYERSAALSAIMQQGSAAFDLPGTLAFNLAAAVMGGAMGGAFLVFYVNERFRDKPYAWTVLAVAASFVVVVGLITLAMGAVVAAAAARSAGGAGALPAFRAFVTDTMHLKNVLFWAPVVMLTQFTLQVSDKFGPRVFWHILWGRYNVPRQEDRIFMFADLKDSTVIAERMASEAYHLLLRDFFADITNPILFHQGEIYQYVGDEVVISWRADGGRAAMQSLRCFFAMQDAIAGRAQHYRSRHGVVPSFKAGLHVGSVTAGEIGIIKRDITYSGDVLNTTSRIQGACNGLGVDLLCSQVLLDTLPPGSGFAARRLGAIELKGKGMKVEVATVTPSAG